LVACVVINFTLQTWEGLKPHCLGFI
jgi:hypothetical protein